MNSNNAIEIKSVTKFFKSKVLQNTDFKNTISKIFKGNSQEHLVLDNISIEIKKGEVVGIIGRNGSGKSTLLKIIARILEPDSGNVEVNGKIASILELGMGFHQDMSGRENIYLKGAMYGFSKSQIDSRIDEIIDYSGLGEFIDGPLRTYSSGMAGRLAFAIMVNVDADIFLIDEILSVGDVAFSAKATEHFKKAAKGGKTIILVSHSASSILEMCNRAIWIEEGKIKENGNVRSVCDHYRAAMTESYEIILDLAELGVADAQYKLALMYRDGNKIGVDKELAFRWMKESAEQNHILALLDYADMLFEGFGTEQDVVSAIQYYQIAADRGNNDARIKLATLMGNNKSEVEEIRLLFRSLAERGNPLNEYRYADVILKTAWNESDRIEAFKWFYKAAENGNLDAKFQIGLMYRDGLGVKLDLDAALLNLRDAANLGHQRAQVILAEMLLSGIKVKKDESEAFKWYLRSAKSGIFKSQYQVAVMYRDGIGINTNYNESKKWFNVFSKSMLVGSKMILADNIRIIKLDEEHSYLSIMKDAANSFNPQAMYRLAIYYRDNVIDFDKDEMIRLLCASAECNNVLAQIALGDMYLKGMFVEKDYMKAFNFYLNAALNGNSVAAYKVALMYRDGIGTEEDKNKYNLFLNLSKEGGYNESFYI